MLEETLLVNLVVIVAPAMATLLFKLVKRLMALRQPETSRNRRRSRLQINIRYDSNPGAS